MTNPVTPEQRDPKEVLADFLYRRAALMSWTYIEHDKDEANELAEDILELLKEKGWLPPQEVLKEQWRDIPGYSYWQMSNGGLVRHKMSHVQVEVSAIFGEPVVITIHDDKGHDVHVLLEELSKCTWPTSLPTEDILEDTFTLAFDNGNTVTMPVGRLTDKSTPIKFVEDLEEPDSFAEDWKDIDSIIGLESFQVSNYGQIRYKFNDKIIEPSFDCGLDKHVVKLTINGKPIFIDGPALAAAMWEH